MSARHGVMTVIQWPLSQSNLENYIISCLGFNNAKSDKACRIIIMTDAVLKKKRELDDTHAFYSYLK